MRRRADTLTVAAVAALCVTGAAGTAHGADPQAGYRLARAWCTSCHIVAPGEGGSDAAPPFETIANRPGLSEDGLRAWLADPHPPMPNLHLSRQEIEQVIAYLRSLRRQ